MDKTLCRNNLGAIGKWGTVSFLSGVVMVGFIFVPIASQSRILDSFGIGRGISVAHAYVSNQISTSSYQPGKEFKLDLTDPLNSINSINNVTLPVNNLINGAIKGLRFDQGVNIGTWIPVISPIKNPSQDIDFGRFFSSSKISSNDVTSFLKEATITGINLSILIISITSQVLKGLLSVLK